MDVLILGAGGHGKIVLDILRAAGEHRPIGFIDADRSMAGTEVCGLPVLGPSNLLPKLRTKARGAIVAIGDNRTRRSCAAMVREHGYELINAIHPAAVVSPGARLGCNVVICAGACVCIDVTLADSVIVNTNAVVDHECEVGEAAHVCPGALLAGRVRVEPGAFVGLGAKVIQCVTIGAGAIVGAGGVVIEDVPPGATAVGVPARVIKLASPATETASTSAGFPPIPVARLPLTGVKYRRRLKRTWRPTMSAVYNPESDIIAEIERLELEARDIRRRVEHAHTEEDKRVLNRQLEEIKTQIEHLRSRLP